MAKDKKEKKGVPLEPARPPEAARHSAKETPRLKARFRKEVAPALMKEFELKNPMAVPHLHKIVVNVGVGEATQNAKALDPAVNELGQITGQKPVVTRAKKSIAAFKVREGQPIGAMVTLRGDRMYEFFDRLVNVVLPRVRDFRGVSTKSFDGRGNYTLGLHDQLIFPGDRLRQGRQAEGDERHYRDDCPFGRSGAGAIAAFGNAVPSIGI